MAKQTITKVLDDLDGSEADETVQFSVDGNLFEIDLTAGHASELREFLATYIDAGTRVGRVGQGAQMRSYRSGSQASSAQTVRQTRQESQAVREWAAAQNFEVADRGRIPQHIVDAYHARNTNPPRGEALQQEVEEAAAPAKKATRRRAQPAQFAAAS